MIDKKKNTNNVSPNKPETGKAFDDADVAASGAVLPDPEEIKLPRLHKEEEHRTVTDVNKPKENNSKEDGDDHHAPFDYRGNK